MKNNFSQITGNPAQRTAIAHTDGPAMVLAGPGSGKTFVIVQRIRFLIESAHIDPQTILVITFTKAAALEMQSRFLKLTDQNYPEVHFGTFHSVFYQIIRLSLSGTRLELITEKEKYHILQHILKELAQNYQYAGKTEDAENLNASADVIREILSEISRIKNDGRTPAQCDETHPMKKYFEQIFPAYQKMMKELGKIDFDDMMTDCLSLLKRNPALLEKWRSVFRYILIDEYQDINLLQFQIIQLLAAPHNNLFIVGDDDQSIYGFRGSRPDIMLNFRSFYPDAKSVFLGINYRSCPEILQVSAAVIAENKIRFQKEMVAGETQQSGAFALTSYPSRQLEYTDIIRHLKAAPEAQSGSAILFRTNAEAAAAAEMLAEAGLPFQSREQLKSPYEDPVIEDLLMYLKFACEAPKRQYLFRIMNKPVRYIRRESIPAERVLQNDMLRYYHAQPSMQHTIRKMFRDFEMLQHLRPSLAIRYIRFETGYEAFVMQQQKGAARTELKEKMDQFQKKAGDYMDSRSFLRAIEEAKENFADNIQDRPKKTGVHLMTLHAAKGLEFDTVYLPDLNEGIIPNRKSVTDTQIEEERRMLYVGMTRAKQALCMSYITGTGENPMMPSRLIRCLKQRS
mgnify:FL=1